MLNYTADSQLFGGISIYLFLTDLRFFTHSIIQHYHKNILETRRNDFRNVCNNLRLENIILNKNVLSQCTR